MALARDLAHEGRVVIVVLHDIGLAARFADRITVRAGRLHAEGSPETVLTPAMLRAVYGVDGRVERCSRGTLQVLIDGGGGLAGTDPWRRVDLKTVPSPGLATPGVRKSLLRRQAPYKMHDSCTF